MQRSELAARLVEAGDAERESLLAANSDLADVQLGYALKDICLDGWSSHPRQALGAAASLRLLFTKAPTAEIAALCSWTLGLESLIHGQMLQAIEYLDDARAKFVSLDKTHVSAATQVSKLIALATLGRYDEAIECGLAAREIFLAHNDLLAAGKIENNIGNIYFRRDDYKTAERFQNFAKERFALLENQVQLAKVNNCLANTHALLHKFSSAEQLYEEAVQQAEDAGLTTTLAEIEGNIGNFALLQGRYDRALDYLERARRRYSSLGMPHQSAIAEQEIADVYLELNLGPEALEIYRKVIPKFDELGMRAEQARATANCARALVLLRKISDAQSLLNKARSLYQSEANEVGAATVMLRLGELQHQQQDFAAAIELSRGAEPAFLTAGSWHRVLLARWLRGEAERGRGNLEAAHSTLDETLEQALRLEQPQVAERCYSSLGMLAASRGDTASAQEYFQHAIDLIEELRAPIPGEELRTAFFSDKLLPYNEMVRLSLSEGRIGEALGFVEAARSRVLAEILGGSLRLAADARDDDEAAMLRQMETLRGELNYIYNQIDRSIRGESAPSQFESAGLYQALRKRETRISEISRQLNHRRGVQSPVDSFSVKAFQSRLGADTALVEYAVLDEELLAFVVTNESVEVVRDLGTSSEVAEEIQRFRFQIDTFRYGSDTIRRHLPLLTSRAQKHLVSLYDILFRKLEPLVRKQRVVIVPDRALHYLPFQALHNGSHYLLEDHEISYAPSAMVLQQCLDKSASDFQNALLLGVADEQIPKVRDEILTISRVFTNASCFLDDAATSTNLRKNAAGADLVHLACHAQFRADNPLFSALHLKDGWLTVRDATNLQLDCGLVTLSACETGVNLVAPGEELIGLTRGFFSAGAPSVLISLWTVDDQATADLMEEFYRQLRRNQTPSSALRTAQIKLLQRTSHPFFWSSFVLVGRW